MAKAATGKRRPPTDDDDDDQVDVDGDGAEKSEADLEGGRMPFLSHLVELRDRVRNAAIFFMLAFVVCWWFGDRIYEWVSVPLKQTWMLHEKELGPFQMAFFNLTQPFWVQMTVGMWTAIFVSSPFIFYQLWRFIAPGLYKRERRVAIWFAGFSAIFFIGGAWFCYHFVLPNLYEFLLSYAKDGIKPLISIETYFELTRDMMLAFGAVFELPLLIYFLAMVGLVTHRSLWKFNRWYIVIASVVAAVLTPSPDVMSQLMMLTPMVLLYNLSIILAWRITIRREAKAAALVAAEAAAEARRRAARAAIVSTTEDEAEDELDDEDEYEDDEDDDDTTD
jgi:sec-independent protein translocase protein TatC